MENSNAIAPILCVSHSIVRRVRALVVLLAAGCSSERHAANDIETVADPVVDGTLATACQWPTALSVNGCSATLVHPKLVTLAAHCLEGGSFPNEVRFGEDDSRPERRVPVETCKGYPDFVVGRTDVAYCTLTSEVPRDVPPTPIIMGCETDFLQLGSNLTLVGFGLTAANAVETSGKKRWADVQLRRFVSTGPSIRSASARQRRVPATREARSTRSSPTEPFERWARPVSRVSSTAMASSRVLHVAPPIRGLDGDELGPRPHSLPRRRWQVESRPRLRSIRNGRRSFERHVGGRMQRGRDVRRRRLCERSIDAGLDEAPPPSDATSGQDASAGDPSDAGSCTCRVGARIPPHARRVDFHAGARMGRPASPSATMSFDAFALGLWPFLFLGLLARPATAAPSVDGWSASGSVLISPLYGEAQAADNHHLGGANVALGARLDGRYQIAGFLFALGTDYMQGAESHPSRHLAIPVRLAFFPIRTHAVEVGAGLGGGPAFSWYPGEPGVGGAALRAIGFMLELRIEGAIPLSDELSLLSSIGARGYSERFTNARPGTYAASGFALPAVAVDLGLGLAWKL